MWYGESLVKTYNEVDRSFYESISIVINHYFNKENTR